QRRRRESHHRHVPDRADTPDAGGGTRAGEHWRNRLPSRAVSHPTDGTVGVGWDAAPQARVPPSPYPGSRRHPGCRWWDSPGGALAKTDRTRALCPTLRMGTAGVGWDAAPQARVPPSPFPAARSLLACRWWGSRGAALAKTGCYRALRPTLRDPRYAFA